MEAVHSGDRVKAGVYLAPSTFDVKYVGAEGETLQGKEAVAYRKVPTALLMIGGPILGGLFVVAFPLIMLGALVYALVKFVSGPKRGATRLMLAALVVPLPAITAMSRRSRPDRASAQVAALYAIRAARPMNLANCRGAARSPR
jgi:hypothetical protein